MKNEKKNIFEYKEESDESNDDDADVPSIKPSEDPFIEW